MEKNEKRTKIYVLNKLGIRASELIKITSVYIFSFFDNLSHPCMYISLTWFLPFSPRLNMINIAAGFWFKSMFNPWKKVLKSAKLFPIKMAEKW